MATVSYAEVVEDFGKDPDAEIYQRGAVDELFTLAEAEAWVAYLRRWYAVGLAKDSTTYQCTCRG
jgi:hypothetical protein